jgi:hypothetical protein
MMRVSQAFRAEALQQHVRRHFENRIADEEKPRAESIGGSTNAEIRAQMLADEADIHPVDVVDDEHHDKERQHMPLDLAHGACQCVRSVRAGRGRNGFAHRLVSFVDRS